MIYFTTNSPGIHPFRVCVTCDNCRKETPLHTFRCNLTQMQVFEEDICSSWRANFTTVLFWELTFLAVAICIAILFAPYGG